MVTVAVKAPLHDKYRLTAVWFMPTLCGMSVGRERLREWLVRSKLSQRAGARLLGMHFTFLSQLLRNNAYRRSPSLATAVKIQRVTGIPVEAWMPTSVDDQRRGVAVGSSKRKIGKQ
jgi:transcriptional regulator with XRE-family HTH domain